MNIEQFVKLVRNPDNFRINVIPHKYYVTDIQFRNFNGESGWDKYLGYVVQIRKKAGLFGSDIILMRMPNGSLISHENQAFYEINGENLKIAKSFFSDGIEPNVLDTEDCTYYIEDKFPAKGLIVSE